MSSIYHYLSSRRSYDDDWKFSGRDSVQISEVWEEQQEDEEARGYVSSTREVGEIQLARWLGSPSRSVSGSASGVVRTRLLRIVWIPRLMKSRCFDVSEDLFELVHRTCKHRVARDYSKTVSAGVGSTPDDDSKGTVQYLSYYPKITVTRSATVDMASSTVICIAEPEKISLLRDLLDQEFAQKICRHQVAMALLCGVLFSIETADVQVLLKSQVRAVEVRTGHHVWKSRKEAPALGDLIALAAAMSGCDTRIASCLRKQKVLVDLIKHIQEQVDLSGQEGQDDHGDVQAVGIAREIHEVTNLLKRRAAAQEVDLDFTRRRARTQLDALYQFVAQHDALIAQEMSQDCRLLATASQRDSFSMKSIAVVTMLFLPATFVSSLLSMPLFDFAANSTSAMFSTTYWRPRLYAFLALTLPLMCLTVGIWGFWTLTHHFRQRRKISLATSQLAQRVFEDETQALSLKRRSLTGQN